jgi:hypothetical protein
MRKKKSRSFSVRGTKIPKCQNIQIALSFRLAAADRRPATTTARLREENASLREQAERGGAETAMLHEENAALRERVAAAERDGTVLKRGVLAQQRRYEEMMRDAAAKKKKAAELEMSNYVLNASTSG